MVLRTAVPATLGASILAACAAPVEQAAFDSPREQACYESVSAALPANQSLRPAANGGYVKATIINNLLRNVERATEFDECMETRSGNASLSDMGPVTFTGEELALWRGLSDEARRDALLFIRDGGTLREFVAR